MKRDFLKSATFSAKNETMLRKDSSFNLSDKFEPISRDEMKFLNGGEGPRRRKDPNGSPPIGWD